MLELNCNGRFLPGVVGAECVAEAFVPECGLYQACEHSITMWDDYGDGWNDGYIDVYVDGELVLAGLTLPSGSGPGYATFEAGTGSVIETVWFAGGWPYECSYCIYDVLGGELGCDGLGGVDPVGITVTGFCGGVGACCDPTTGICVDDVDAVVCIAEGKDPYPDQLCADLDPACGDPGACCDDETAICTDDVLKLNCAGRHASAMPCDPDPFTPPCGEWVPVGMMYAPTEADNPTFRSAVGAIIGGPCDYFDARIGTPTLAQLQEYECVMTWVNYAYADSVGMGDVLADYVDAGGKVILGQWTEYSGQVNWLEGRIMTAGYCPVDATSVSSGSYNGDGVDCVHVVGPVTAYSSDYLDVCTLLPGNMSDGTMTTGSLAVAFTPARGVYYSPGNTGLTYSSGDWAQLTANMCQCSGDVYGACCDPYTTVCTDDVHVMDCPPPLQWTYETLCADLMPPCGNPGACCDIYTGNCTDDVLELLCEFDRFESGEQCAELDPECGTPGCCCEEPEEGVVKDPVEMLEANCNGRFLPGVTGAECVAEAFDPFCGLWECSGLLYAPTEADNPEFRAAVTAATGQPCDYYDARIAVPTLEELSDYCCVFTWGNYAYADPVAMGDVLADFVDANGKVILGQWTVHTTQVNWLEGRIMEPEYCPITASSYVYNGTYAGDGVDCVHVLGPVTAYDTSYRDQITPIAGALSDGTFVEDGMTSVAWRADRAVYYSAGNTGGTFTPSGLADWGLLTANMCRCTDEELIGACCDEPNQVCYEDMPANECIMPGARFILGGVCADFDPPCGEIYGACCYMEECVYQRPSECAAGGGAYEGDGIPCDPNPCLCADFWVDAPGSWDGDLLGAGDDCDLRPGEDQIWAVNIPYDGTWAFSLCGGATFDTYMYVGTTCCGQEVGSNDDDCYYGPYDALQSEVRATITAGTYYVDVEPYSTSTVVGPVTLSVFDVHGACCNDVTGVCVDGELIDNCFDADERFAGGTLCADMVPPCEGMTSACCVSGVCVGDMMASECAELGGDWFMGESCDAGFVCPYGCTHTVELWDDYGDGWNGGMLDVIVNGVTVLSGITLDTGAGPATFTFLADTGDTITTVYTAGSWAYENYYYIYDGVGTQICADGEGGVEPTGCTATGFCPTCDHTVTLWDDYGDGWNDGLLDVLVNGVPVLTGLTLATGAGPESHTFTAATGDTISTVFTPGGWPYECSYCIYGGQGDELGCDGLGGVDPTGITVTGSCTAAECGDGACTGDEDCCNCPEDCPRECLVQPPNQVNGIFSDVGCDACASGIQVLADQFPLPGG
jgi:hypothetical protein